jgi:hypothetical protein
MSSYWKASKKLSDAIRELWKADIENTKQVQALAEEIGAKSGLMSIHWGRVICVGFEFETPPDPKKFYEHKNHSDGWIPRATGRNKTSIRNRMSQLQSTLCGDVSDLIKFNPMRSGKDGLGYWNPGIKQKDCVFYLTMPTNYKPAKGIELTRISDVEFEALEEAPKKKKRAKKCSV